MMRRTAETVVALRLMCVMASIDCDPPRDPLGPMPSKFRVDPDQDWPDPNDVWFEPRLEQRIRTGEWRDHA